MADEENTEKKLEYIDENKVYKINFSKQKLLGNEREGIIYLSGKAFNKHCEENPKLLENIIEFEKKHDMKMLTEVREDSLYHGLIIVLIKDNPNTEVRICN